MNDQPDLFPDLAMTTFTVTGMDLGTACDRVRAMDGVILGITVKGATYSLSVLLPPGEVLSALADQTTTQDPIKQ